MRAYDLISDYQFGAVPGRSSDEYMVLLAVLLAEHGAIDILATDEVKTFPSRRRQVTLASLARKGIIGKMLRALMELISGLRARVVAGQAKSFEYAMLDTLPEGKVLSPLAYILGADGLPRGAGG